MIRRLLAAATLLALVALIALVALAATRPATAASQPATAEATTTLPVDTANRSVIPAPNSGHPPTESGDRGGWAQLTLFGIMFAGSIVIFGRVLWAGHQRSRANQVD